MGRVFVDYSRAVPRPDRLVEAGVSGMWRYVGTPGNPKNLTAREYRAARDVGLVVYGVYELGTHDWQGGRSAGEQNAVAARADFTRCGASESTPIAMAVDDHVEAPEALRQARAYQAGARTVLGGSAACYGPVEVMHAVRLDRTASILWQWGHRPAADNPDRVAFWQRNEPGSYGPSTQVVDGVQCDISDELIRRPTSMFLNGEWDAGTDQTHRVMALIGNSSQEFGAVRFHLVSGSAWSGRLTVVGRTGSAPSYPIDHLGFTLQANWRGAWDAPVDTDQVIVTYTSASSVAWALEMISK